MVQGIGEMFLILPGETCTDLLQASCILFAFMRLHGVHCFILTQELSLWFSNLSNSTLYSSPPSLTHVRKGVPQHQRGSKIKTIGISLGNLEKTLDQK